MQKKATSNCNLAKGKSGAFLQCREQSHFMSGGHSTRWCALSFVYHSHLSHWSKQGHVTAICAEHWDTIFGITHDMVDHISVSSSGKWIIHPHLMMTSANGNIFRVTGLCAGNSPVTGEFLAQRPVTRSSDVFFDLRVNKQLNKQSWGWWFGTLSCSLWRHCDGLANIHHHAHSFDIESWEAHFKVCYIIRQLTAISVGAELV